MDTELLKTQGLDGSVKWINEVIFARLSPDVFEAAVTEFFSYDVKFGSALLGKFCVDDAFDSSLDVVGWLSVKADLKRPLDSGGR